MLLRVACGLLCVIVCLRVCVCLCLRVCFGMFLFAMCVIDRVVLYGVFVCFVFVCMLMFTVFVSCLYCVA